MVMRSIRRLNRYKIMRNKIIFFCMSKEDKRIFAEFNLHIHDLTNALSILRIKIARKERRFEEY